MRINNRSPPTIQINKKSERILVLSPSSFKDTIGELVGDIVGEFVDIPVGENVGEFVGEIVGDKVGDIVGRVQDSLHRKGCSKIHLISFHVSTSASASGFLTQLKKIKLINHLRNTILVKTLVLTCIIGLINIPRK